MSARVFQSVLLQIKDATDRVVGVVDDGENVIACTELSQIGQRFDGAAEKPAEPGTVSQSGAHTCKTLCSIGSGLEFTVFVKGTDEEAATICGMAAVALSNARNAYDEKHDKLSFVKNIILDNVLPADIFLRSKELGFTNEITRAVFLIRQVNNADLSAVDVLQNLFSDKQKNFLITISEKDIVLIKEVSQAVTSKDLRKIAMSIEQALNEELYIKVVIGIGTIAQSLRDLANCYKEAQTAIDVGRVFDANQSIINYENLGIGRLIYQLPTTLCEMFIAEVFKKNSFDNLDNETLFTITKFFENNLNVSETARKLFVHRNTLVYRLDKIKKTTGLDLRSFENAITFKVALMVKRYLTLKDTIV